MGLTTGTGQSPIFWEPLPELLVLLLVLLMVLLTGWDFFF